MVEIPQSDTAHQSKDKKYYKRLNTTIEAMLDYEIRDVMGRNKNPKLELSFLLKSVARSGINEYYVLVAKVTNIGSVYAKYVNLIIEIPKIILPKNIKITSDTYPWQIDNTIRDLITESKLNEKPLDANYTLSEFKEESFTKGSSRYVPILPGLSREWEFGIYNMSSERAYFITDEKITWKIYADNALPKIGKTLIKNISYQEFTYT